VNVEISTLTREFVQRLSATRRGARLARYLAVQQLDAWGVPYGTLLSDRVAAVVGELAANAVTHGRVPGRDFELRLGFVARAGVRTGAQTRAQAVRVEVTDTRGERRPSAPGRAEVPPDGAESGWGLVLVQALSRAWGVTDRAVGKTVWAEVGAGALPTVRDGMPQP
jgi:anti-sigma regulatory factor (Ser/Thr protein kinase)